ncbi:unnamed protein product [Toxocara canis]|uniref:Arrestin_N domain-containing protein n=1 Tax=Toxocara canis TaxID=6265 RepID=A0A183TZG0_TOXCA|nr:unnamed protein product [Toxocara canis]
MPFVTKWIEPERSLIASVSAGFFFEDMRFSISPSGELSSVWNIANSAMQMIVGEHLRYYEVNCRAISGHHSPHCDFEQIHFYLHKGSSSASFMLPPIAGPCLYQIQLSAVFRNCPTKIFSKTITYAAPSSVDGRSN